MNNQTVAFIAIVAVVALVFTAAIVTQDADARRRHGSVHQTSTQVCINDDARCQNVNSQNSGSDIGSVTIGNQP
jgi:hypothetical protein